MRMGAEKGGSKSSGFFHLFDWNRKSRKKLFSSGTNSPESSKQGKRSDSNLPTTRLHLNEDDEIIGVSRAKGSSDYSCASSVTDEEGNGVRAPGVVARLMGLDSLPTSGVSEPFSTPFLDSRSLRDNCTLKRSPEFSMNDQFNHAPHKAEGYFRKQVELRSQKMPSSPIERFQKEILRPRSAKSLPITHHKLLSPIKNPGFTSAKNAAQIMEAAAKILEPGLQASTRGKISLFGSSSIPLKVRDPKESMAASQKTSRPLELSRTPFQSTDVSLSRGQSLNRTCNVSEDIVIFRSSPDPYEMKAASTTGKGKSISLAIQAKVNVQRREGLSTSCRNTLIQKEHDDYKLNQPFISQPNNQKNKQQKKPSITNASGVLRQNNQKQNCSSTKGKLALKQSNSSQQGRKILSGDSSSGKHKTVNRFSGNLKSGSKKEVLVTTDVEREGSSSHKDFPRKKRLIEGGFKSGKSGFIDNMSVDRNENCIQSNVVIDNHSRWNEDKRNATDVVSFTFTSPLIKQLPGSQSSIQGVEKEDKRNGYSFDSCSEKNASDAKNKRLASLGLNVINGDALSLLLEQKLRELTAGMELSSNFLRGGTFASSASVLQESKSAYNTDPTQHWMDFQLRACKDSADGIFNSECSSTNGQLAEGMDCNGSSGAQKESDDQHHSPLSIFDATFSNQSCNSLESTGSTDGSKICSSSVQAQNVPSLSCSSKIPSMEAEMELSDSASSAFMDLDALEISSTNHTKVNSQDLNYVREILYSRGLSKDLSSCYLNDVGEILDSLLFEKLENKRSRTILKGVDQDGRVKRKVLFDCLNECLESKCSRYFRAGFHAWTKGLAVVGKGLAEELYEEILGWKSMGDSMVDELVDKDMSSHLGRWVDFEIEVFETGVELEGEILSSLVDEVVADLCIKG
ncbi:uncharacterized protein LOC103704637 [Phoenix dactylifera]|uniref:Uncharacterized protein LOC103704637 n=1 Tax=Phoenix dactylifera TaxID=42345 RepID=A0A8B8ZI19_PHODC|nr:uncharacterized protein LOC103704637 [Phoenix dactylifera]XP_038973810.1 uncharacterized protein LOC103704637 [Phoenix dactylifera]